MSTNIPEDKSSNVLRRKISINRQKQKERVEHGVIPLRRRSTRLLSRVVVGISLCIIYFMYKKQDKVAIFARQSDVLSAKTVSLQCSTDYIKEIKKFPGCVPSECRRFVSDTTVSQQEADDMLRIFHKFLEYGGSPNGVSILDLHSGALSKGDKFINVNEVKQLKSLLTEDDLNKFRVIKEKIRFTISNFFMVDPDKIYLTFPTFFSKLENKEPANIHDEYWHKHVDKETYETFHFTSLLYLSDYKKDFEGGRFIFIDDNKHVAVEPRKGRLSIFTSGSENTHHVERVVNGSRYAMTISFTCDEKQSSHI